jgi:hypothetical protein
MLEWLRIRDEVTCEVYYDLYDHNISRVVVTIREVDKRYKVRILDHMPFHTKTIRVAKEVGQHIYEQTCVEQLMC